jgi:hypothetical protein
MIFPLKEHNYTPKNTNEVADQDDPPEALFGNLPSCEGEMLGMLANGCSADNRKAAERQFPV